MKSIAFLLLTISAGAAASQDKAFLDPAYKDIHKPSKQTLGFNRPVPRKSNTAALIANQSPVRSQASRGTCSIFSSTAMLESMMIINGLAQSNTIDLSEEWLEYQITRRSGNEGSSSAPNFQVFLKYGDAQETLLPYIGETWENATFGLAQTRCAHLTDTAQKTCLIAHRDPNLQNLTDDVLLKAGTDNYDPDFQAARKDALDFKTKYLAKVKPSFYVSSVNEAKALLAGTAEKPAVPVSLDIDFFYGAWNHRGGAKFGLKANADHWAKGIIGYPEPGSIDADKSPTDHEGHSILVVGYDDDVVVTNDMQMSDGTTKTFTYKGVYYFKNSWGTSNFGTQTTIDGQVYPGYGMMVQKYAEDKGGFAQLPLKR